MAIPTPFMAYPTLVNSQITDAVTQQNVSVLAAAAGRVRGGDGNPRHRALRPRSLTRSQIGQISAEHCRARARARCIYCCCARTMTRRRFTLVP
jgi:hypothetical protein